MKPYVILVFLLLFTYIKLTCLAYDSNLTGIKDCGQLNSAEKEAGKTHCCFAQNGDEKVCVAYTDKEYEEKKNSQGTVVQDGVTYIFECYLPYIKLGFFNLLFFALWI